MKFVKMLFSITCLGVFCVPKSYTQEHHFKHRELHHPVEIITDVWGIPHIYAQNEEDLFFAQGFYAAKDRLFQFEIWRRQANGTVAEILGARELQRDFGTRLFKFRGDMIKEMRHYHDRGDKIITSYVQGVNAYIDDVLSNPDELPLEFDLLGILPEHWTPEIVISRHQGLLGNINQELQLSMALGKVDQEVIKELTWFHPKDPDLTIDPKIDVSLLSSKVLEVYNAFRRPISFQPDDIVAAARSEWSRYSDLAEADKSNWVDWKRDEALDIGSNNWVIGGELTESGYPIMANDPHRRQSVPSLRYMCHLVAPGWNVIGGGEPEIPGISIGHNEYGAWGLTVFSTDAEDLYVYEINPEDPSQYWYQGAWENMRILADTIPVKDREPEIVQLSYTRHGPVTYIDRENNKAYAVRCGWLEIGGSPYLASLRMNQARNFEEFQEACNYSHIPGENMVWADREGNIGWQAVGIAPIRKNWSGMVAIPGDGSYEWDGYLPIISKPNLVNPANHIINTSNENVTPPSYKHWNAVGYAWSDPYRGDRVMEVLDNGRRHSLADMALLQTDYLSIPARQIVPLLLKLEFEAELYQHALELIESWDYRLESDSRAAGIYNLFERQLRIDMNTKFVPDQIRSTVSLQMKRIIEWLYMPDSKFGFDPLSGRDEFLSNVFIKSVDSMVDRFGENMDRWQYGQVAYKHVLLKHPLSNAVTKEIRDRLDVGPIARGGNSYTVNNTSSSENQMSGGSFRMIVDTGNWDHSIGTNTPGQNGDPDHLHYKNLFESWATDQFFPVFYSRKKVESVRYESWHLSPE